MPDGEPTALRVLVVQRRVRTYETFRRQFEESARELAAESGDQRFAGLSVSRTQFERWLRGGVTTRPYYAASTVLTRMFGMDVDMLLGPVSAADMPSDQEQTYNLQSEITMAAHESSEHAGFASARSVDDETIELLQEDVLSAARRYPEKSPVESFAEAKRIRDHALSLLDRTGRPAQETDLYVTVGQACGILATCSFDLGFTDSAAEQARSVFMYGRMVAHDGLCAWALGMRALIHNWDDKPLKALELVNKGLALAPDGTPTVRLHAIGARAWAALSNAGSAVQSAQHALESAEEDSIDDLHDQLGGEFSFDAARLARCLSSVYVSLRMADPAAEQARHVLELYEGGAAITRMPKVASEARIDLAHAFVIGGELDAAKESLAPVFDLVQASRVRGVTGRLNGIRRALTAVEYQRSPLALEMGERIESFTEESAGAIAPALTQ